MAHRGASDLAPENSMAAFRLALDHEADLLETDLWLSSDGEPVCHHDPTLARMTGDPRLVTDLSLAELDRLRLRDPSGEFPDERIPRLAEVLAAVPISVPIMLEIKDRRLADPVHVRHLAGLLGERAAATTVGIIGFDLRVVLTIRAHMPGAIVGHITRFNPLPIQPTDLLGPYYPLLWLNPAYVRMAHRRGRRVCPLDPRLHDHLVRYLRMDVDAVLTNDPRATRGRIEALRSEAT